MADHKHDHDAAHNEKVEALTTTSLKVLFDTGEAMGVCEASVAALTLAKLFIRIRQHTRSNAEFVEFVGHVMGETMGMQVVGIPVDTRTTVQ